MRENYDLAPVEKDFENFLKSADHDSFKEEHMEMH